MGLSAAQGLVLTNAFYWDRDEETRAFSKRFFAKMKRMPHMGDAGDYSSTMHYLNAIKAAGTDDAKTVMAKMREMPVNDFFAKNGRVREDGRFVHDMYVYEVKKPSDSKYAWDYYKLRSVIPGDEAFRPLSDSKCPLVKK
jgi:branched-chain amino acid transport system substrate-binding protein